MKIIALIRQDGKNTVSTPDRSGVEAALRLKRQTGGFVTALCLGSHESLSFLREALSMGCDDAVLISDPAFWGADPAGSAAILAAAIKSMTYDVIFTSCYAVDADTIQIGFLLAERLLLPQAGYAEDISLSDHSTFLVKRRFEDRVQMLELPAPCLISALPHPNKRIYGTVEGITRAYSVKIPILTREKILTGKLKNETGAPFLGDENVYVRCLSSCEKKERKRGTVLTVPTDEAVTAILDTLIRHHIL